MELSFMLLRISAIFIQIALAHGKSDLGPPNIAENFLERRTRRELDDEDVVNRFEMERVSPLYDIIRNLPAFDDGWLPNPVTGPNFALPTTRGSYNGSAAFGKLKIELSEDEEHVVSESGRQFQENSALNWYYSAESYTSVNHQNKSNIEYSKFDISIPKGVTRKLDEEHVVSHVPSLRGERGALIGFNLLQSSTTPKMDLTIKAEDPKPNITTRYILLQSGRIVAINVTSVPSVYKTNSSGSTGRNTNLPTIFFGSRIRNNSTKSSVINNSTDVSSHREDKVDSARLINQTTRLPITYLTHTSYSHLLTTIRPLVSTVHKNPVQKISQQISVTATTVKPVSVKRADQSDKVINSRKPPLTTPTLRTAAKDKAAQHDSEKKQQKHTVNKSIIKPYVVYIKSQHLAQAAEPAKPADVSSTEFVPTLDEALRWWSEMQAKNQKTPSATTSIPHRNIFQTLLDSLQPTTKNNSLLEKTSSSKTKQAKEIVTSPPVASNTEQYRESKSEKVNSPKRTRGEKSDKSQSTHENILQATSKNTSSGERDVLEPPVPLTERRHEFVRIATLQPPSFSSTSPIPPTSKSSQSSRRPRYRGLQHVNLRAPIKQTYDVTTRPSRLSLYPQTQDIPKSSQKPIHEPIQYRSTTEASKSLSGSQLQGPVSNPPPRRSRHGFHLKNSLSFQTIPPGSLTDRRTLTWDAPVTTSAPVENLPPPLEHLLIISFEPTRKSVFSKETEEFTEQHRKPAENIKKHTVPTKKAISAFQRKPLPVSSPKPVPRKPTQRPAVEGSTGSNRSGRNFRTNVPKAQSVKTEEDPIIDPVTNKPFRVYFFEPKRKNSKISETKDESDTPTRSPQIINSRRSYEPSKSPRYKQFNPGLTRTNSESNNSRRQPKQLTLFTEDQRPPSASSTTPKPLIKKLKSSPFIWHRPNVGTTKPVSRDVLVEVATQQTSSQSPINRRYDDGFYRPQRG